MSAIWFVSRQRYWQGGSVVEIALGGRDYANPDMLVPAFRGEGEEYDSALEAVNAAIEIRDAWRNSVGEDGGAEEIEVALGATHGFTISFDAWETGDEELRRWAVQYDRAMEAQDEAEHFGMYESERD